MKIWFDGAEPDGDDTLWFDTTISPDKMDVLEAAVRFHVKVSDETWQQLSQEMLIYLWLNGRKACGDSWCNVIRLGTEFFSREVAAEKQRVKRANRKKGGELSDWDGAEEDRLPLTLSEEVLRLLTSRQTDAARLYYEEGLTEAEVGAKLGVTQQAVAKLLTKTKQTVLSYLTEGET